MPIAVTDTINLRIGINVAGTQTVVIHHAEVISLGSTTGDQSFADAIIQGWLVPTVLTPLWEPINSSQLQVNCAAIQRIDPSIENSYFNTLNATGNLPGDCYPANKALMSRYYTGSYGRGRTGRTYWPAPEKGFIHRGRLEAASQAGWQNLTNAFIGNAVGNNAAEISFRLWSPTDEVSRQVLTGVIDPIVRSQRQRVAELC